MRIISSTLMVIGLVLLLGACAASSSAVPEDMRINAVVAADLPPGHPNLALPTEEGRYFATSGRCVTCHTNMFDENNQNVSMGELWRSSMMANSGRDPYWQATVRKEVLEHPQYQSAIEDKCATCHTSMARFTVATEGETAALTDAGFFDPQHPMHTMAMDGVSCTMCHQVQPGNLGQAESFSGHFEIDTVKQPGERVVYGPSELEEALTLHMQGGSTYLPMQGSHIQTSEMCATCHTLHTDSINNEGELLVGSQFPEQMPYKEWQHSDYATTNTCQSCHMPEADGAVQRSATGGEPRPNFSQHFFVGGNVYMLEVFRRFGEELGVTAGTRHFADTIERALNQLENDTATVTLEQVSLNERQITADVLIESHTGHKLPSAYPSRRAWLHVMVRDADGQVIFESGAVNHDGSINGNNNDRSATEYEPHHEVIDNPFHVQVYEAVMADSDGKVTTGLLSAVEYVKDNRLLPAGFNKFTAEDDIAVHGAALYDQDFVGGSDRTRYVIDVGSAPAPFTVSADLCYQTIAYRWAENMRPHSDAPEIARFLRYYDAVPNLPAVIGSATTQVSEQAAVGQQ
ncbi:MAG: hypothetical protein HC837_10600 [Chloroflexaceae bacterium]|nr:hypothetical protein [Chloroflexaceae bacterium]